MVKKPPKPASSERTLAAKLNHLYSMKRRPNGREYSNQYVADAAVATGLVKTCSQAYLWQLRNGTKDNPTTDLLKALAAFFEVPVSYFVDDEVAERVDRQLAGDHDASTSHDIQLIAARAGKLSAAGRQQVRDLVDYVYRLEAAEHTDHSNESSKDDQR
ncbi:XRE family transcriptional regulator [Amycolatopsis sp. NPDC059021]|uniref:XRE family transcriptional regulator n=1 Tax=Amycolatopsis sp. NPDC059021 TaxID=3346704 RepID=UPI0036718BAE